MSSNPELPRIIFFGTPGFAAEILRVILDENLAQVLAVVTQPDRPAGRGHKLLPSPVKQLAESHQLPILQPERIKKEQATFLEDLAVFGPCDLSVVVAFGQILPEAILKHPKYGCLNIHASILPRWRGASPIQHSLLHGDPETGICLMQMDSGLDTGPVYIQEKTAILEEDNFASLHDRLVLIAQNLIRQNLWNIAYGKLVPKPQDAEGATYAHKLEGNFNLIDWSKSTREICNLVRACSPAPGAYTMLQGKRLKIMRAGIALIPSSNVTPAGTVLSISPDSIAVKCLDGVLSIYDVQPEGKRVMSIKDYLAGNSHWLKTGLILG